MKLEDFLNAQNELFRERKNILFPEGNVFNQSEIKTHFQKNSSIFKKAPFYKVLDSFYLFKIPTILVNVVSQPSSWYMLESELFSKQHTALVQPTEHLLVQAGWIESTASIQSLYSLLNIFWYRLAGQSELPSQLYIALVQATDHLLVQTG